MSSLTLRVFQSGDETVFHELVSKAFRGFEYLPGVRRLTSSSEFDPLGFFFAEEDGLAKGCVGVFNLYRPKWLEVKYLAAANSSSRMAIGEKLARRAVQYAKSKAPDFLMASTLAVQPYVNIYKSLGFHPVRRILRITWDLSTSPTPRESSIETREVSEAEKDVASQVFVKASQPYWDWWIEEKGGKTGVVTYLKDRMGQKSWICAIVDGNIVGLMRVSPDNYAPQEAGFWGVYVLPEFRGRGIGSTLMSEALTRARQSGQRKVVVFTVAALDSLLPAVLLYLKNGGKIEAEYLHLVMGPDPGSVTDDATIPIS